MTTTFAVKRYCSLLLPPIVERVELSVYRKASLMSCLFKVSDSPHDFCIVHIPCVIILIQGEDAKMQGVRIVKSLKVGRVLRQDGEAIVGSITKVDFVILAFQPTFWTSGFGVLQDAFGIGWEVNCSDR